MEIQSQKLSTAEDAEMRRVFMACATRKHIKVAFLCGSILCFIHARSNRFNKMQAMTQLAPLRPQGKAENVNLLV